MRMKLIALAVASIAAVPAFAQSNVTIYGRADGGFVSRSGSDGGITTNGRKNEFASGIGAGSRFGFRGTEDLGGGLKAIFQFEYNVAMDSAGIAANQSGLGSRNSWVGLTSDSFGTIVTGRLDGVRYSIANQYDPFGGGYVGNMGSIQTHATRGDNAIAYISPSFSGFKVLAAYTTSLIGQEYGSAAAPACAALLPPAPAAGAGFTVGAGAQTVANNQLVPVIAPYEANSCDVQLWAIKPTFDMGGLSLTLDYESFENKNVDNSDGDIWVVAGSYDFKFMKIAGYWEQVKTDRNGAAPVTGNGYTTASLTGANANFAGGFSPSKAMDQQSYMLGVTVPVGNFSLRGSWVGLKDDTTADLNGRQRTGDCDKYSLGASYNLSKRTSLYMDYAWISQDSMSTCTISFSAATGGFDNGGVGPAAGYGTKGFDLGIAHTF